jgi:hypothetical protein
MNLKVAKNINEYKTIIDDLKSTSQNIWYRGMSKSTYSLTPSLFREKRMIGLEYSGREINGKYYRKSDAIMKSDLYAIDEFIKHYKMYYPEKCINFNMIDFLYIMQHYDIPTRLLDFSKDELIALYFSVSSDINESSISCEDEINDFYENKGYTDKGSSIHCIDPIFTNENTNMFYNIKDEILNIDNIDKKSLTNILLPLCIETSNNDSRINAQKGVFMIFGSDYLAYDKYEVFANRTTKIFIPNSCRSAIRKELKEGFDIYHATVYPDIKGIALEIIEQIESKYRNDCNAIFK